MINFKKVEILTFVPNQYCNFSCSYCYLGKLTYRKTDYTNVIDNFKKTIDVYTKDNIGIKEFSFHGAEITTLPYDILEELFQICQDYSDKYKTIFLAMKEGIPGISIKTNLYFFDKFIDLFKKYNVYVSGSVDIPFSHHDKFRVNKAGRSTLEKVKNNLILATNEYSSNRFCISTTIGKYALENIEEFMDNIEWLDSIGYDIINRFYIMFIYDSINSEIKTGLTDDEMVIFYNKLLERWKGTKFEVPIYYGWFREFLSGYCTHDMNCAIGNKLVQTNGNVYPCHRGQAESKLFYGNIFVNPLEYIRNNAFRFMEAYENNNPELHQDCMECDYFYICNTGCPIERNNRNSSKCYTCKLQLEIYKSLPNLYPADKHKSNLARDEYIRTMQPKVYDNKDVPRIMKNNLELYEHKNSLVDIVKRDDNLKVLFKSGAFKLIFNNEEVINLFSDTYEDKYLTLKIIQKDQIVLYIDKEYLNHNPLNISDNYIYIMFLNTDMVVYGDEQRTKMKHIGEYRINLEHLSYDNEGNGYVDVTNLFLELKSTLVQPFENMVYFTTEAMRKYHYYKQSINAFYHIQAINLPFHSAKFTYTGLYKKNKIQ